MNQRDKKIGLIGLTAIVFGSVVGGGIFNIPQNMAQGASLVAVIIAWVISGTGILFLVETFKILNDERPDLKSGIYTYAREGFGEYVGFNSAWGYWLSAALGNVAFVIMLNDALGRFFPILQHHGLPTIILGSILIWFVNAVVRRGIQNASFLNVISTVAKFIAIGLIVAIFILFFKTDLMLSNPWGKGYNLGSIPTQVMSCMMVTLWCFMGVEGAVVVSDRAQNSRDVGKATLVGFILALILYMALSTLSFGFLTQPELAKLDDPSTAYVLQKGVGNWAVSFVNICVIISVGGAWLAWTILTAEVSFYAAKSRVFPKLFRYENKKGAPSYALIITSIIMQCFLLLVVTANNVYLMAINVAAVMILPPYLLSSLFLTKASLQKKIYADDTKKRNRAFIIGLLSSIYCVWMIYSAKLSIFISTSVFYLIGIYFYYKAHHDDKHNRGNMFGLGDKLLMLGFVIAAIMAVVLIATDKLNLAIG